MIPDDDKIDFLEEEDTDPSSIYPPWRILIVDDKHSVHEMTKLILNSLVIHGRKFTTLNAYTGKEAIEILKSRDDIDMVLLDCIMETATAGFEVADFVKYVLGKTIPIIVMRSGHTGMDPENIITVHPAIDEFVHKDSATIGLMRSILMKWLPVRG